MKKKENKEIENCYSKGWIIREDALQEIEYHKYGWEIKIIEYGYEGQIFRNETEAIAYLALKKAKKAEYERKLEKEQKKWWQIWK